MKHLTPETKKFIRLVVVQPLLFKEKRLEVGEVFEVEAHHAGAVLATKLADFADQTDRELASKLPNVRLYRAQQNRTIHSFANREKP